MEARAWGRGPWHKMRVMTTCRCELVFVLLLAAGASLGCSDSATDSGGDPPAEDAPGDSGDGANANGGAADDGATDDGGDDTTGTGGDTMDTPGTDDNVVEDPATDDPASGFTQLGVCGVRGESTVNTADTFEGYQEFFIIGDEGFGVDVCVVRFTVSRAGDAPEGCENFAGQQDECLWTHLVEFSDPEVMLDEGGVCGNSELGLDMDAIAAIDGSQEAYGYVFEFQGHNSVLLRYDAETETWAPNGNASWDADTSDFFFDRRDGFCMFDEVSE